MVKSTFTKLPPKKIVYRSFKNFSKESFTDELTEKLGQVPSANFSSLHEVIVYTLNKHAPNKSVEKSHHEEISVVEQSQ